MRLVRSPNVVAWWKGESFIVEEFRQRRRIAVSPLIALLLSKFSKPRSAETVAKDFPPYSPESVRREIRRLERLGLLVPAGDRERRFDLAAAWKNCLPAAFLHASSTNKSYFSGARAQIRYFRKRLAEERQPPLYKDYRRARLVPFPKDPFRIDATLREALENRRTVRKFTRRPVRFADLAVLVEGTFGQTGWLEAGVLGRLLLKRTPSAGSRHPIECYVAAWNVEGLAPGLYHYSVRRHGLELLKSGDFRREAVRLASAQHWVARMGFACLLTSVFHRTLWKYSHSGVYRSMLMDAGHLGQTFVLLATALGLGPFQTAALQETRIEKFLGIDGVTEFPVYLLGAGYAARSDPSGAKTRMLL